MKKNIIGLFALFGAFALATQIYLGIFVDCYSQSGGTAVSPDTIYAARYSTNICEGEVPRLDIYLGETNSNSITQIFTAVATTTTDIRMMWDGERTLKVMYPNSLNPETKVDNVRDVRVVYTSFRDDGT